MLALTFQIGSDRVALDTHRVVEVVPRVHLQEPVGGPAWLSGLFVYRGRVVPVVDLHELVGLGPCPPLLSSRIILIAPADTGDRLVGLLAAQVAEVREVQVPAASPARFAAPGQADLGPVVVEQGTLLRLLDVERLLPDGVRQHLATLPRELPCP